MHIILDLIERFVNISGNPIVDSIIFLFIGFISFSVAFDLVGLIFDAIGKYNSKIMSNLHWSIRILVFIGLTFIFVKIVQFISWLFSLKWWIYLTIVVSIIILIMLFFLIKYLLSTNTGKKKVIRKIKNFFAYIYKILFDLLLGLTILIAFIVNYKYFNQINKISQNLVFLRADSLNFIIIIFPFVLTILSISLSLPKELIYGLEKTAFRKFEKASRYNFLQMLFIALFVFVLYFIGSTLNYLLIILVLAIISIIYSCYFLWQEIPLLIHCDKRIEKIIKKNFWMNVSNKDLNTVLHNLLFKKGIVYTYALLMKKGNEMQNFKIINALLDLQNHCFWRLRENLSDTAELNPKKYNNLEIIDVIDKSFENIEHLINDDLNIIEIYDNKDYSHHITRLLFSLNDVLIRYGMSNKSDYKFKSLLYQIFAIISLSADEYSNKVSLNYKIVNTMVVYTLASDNLWFVDLLGKHVFVTSNILGGKIEYMVFLTIYFSYLIGLEKDCPPSFKEEMKKFLNKDWGHTSIYGSNWNNVYNTRLMHINHKENKELLQKLLYIYKTSNSPMFWYNRSDQSVSTRNVSKSFNDRLILNWWISYILNNRYGRRFMDNESRVIPKLSEEYKYLLARELHDNWFEDGELKDKKDLFYLELFNMNTTINDYTINSAIAKELSSFSKNELLKKLSKDYDNEAKDPDVLDKYKEMFSNGFNRAIESIVLLDKNINLKDEEDFYFNIGLETFNTETLIDMYVEEFPRWLEKVVYDDFVSNTNIKTKTLDEYTKNEIDEIIKFEPNYKLGYIYNPKAEDDLKMKINKLNEIPEFKNVWLPHDIYIKEGAIKVNFEYIDNKTNIRPLTAEEIDIIIDRDFRLVNGLYKYLESSNSKSGIMLTRKEIFDLISNKYLFASLAFKFKIEYDYQKILYFKKNIKITTST